MERASDGTEPSAYFIAIPLVIWYVVPFRQKNTERPLASHRSED